MNNTSLTIDVVDNGGQWTHREWRILRYLGVNTRIIPNSTNLHEIRNLDGLVLSGGAARVGLTGELGNCSELLTLSIPILGICAGHQFMARHYGGEASEAKKPEFGSAEITLIENGGPIFEDTPSRQIVWESHNDEVSLLPPGFTITAKSISCAIQAMQNLELKRFGLQFHPEVNDTEFGSKIFENFVDICKRTKK